jgi:hypothetical protein
VAEVQARDHGVEGLQGLLAGGQLVRAVLDVAPRVPHVRHEALDAGVAGLAERLLDQPVGLGLDGQPGAVGVLGVAAALEKGVADSRHVVGAHPGADTAARGVEGRHRTAAEGLQVRPLAGVALGVDVGDVLPGDVQRAALRPQRRRRRVQRGERTHLDSSPALVVCVRSSLCTRCELARSLTVRRPA